MNIDDLDLAPVAEFLETNILKIILGFAAGIMLIIYFLVFR